jgi:KUP system potassium uptake protein
MDKGFLRIIIRYGFMEDPDIPQALETCRRFGEPFDMMETTFFVSRETVIPGVVGRNINPWRARLFSIMSKNATSATDFFKIPNNRVVEMGTQLVI